MCSLVLINVFCLIWTVFYAIDMNSFVNMYLVLYVYSSANKCLMSYLFSYLMCDKTKTNLKTIYTKQNKPENNICNTH